MTTFTIGQSVVSAYHGINGKVVAHALPFGGRSTIVVEHQVRMLGAPEKSMPLRRTFLSQDFNAA